MTYTRRSYTRRVEHERDARLIVIAAEDTQATPIYFEAVKEFYKGKRVQVEILRRETTSADPDHVLEQLNQWKREYMRGNHDELWLVIDVDRWPEGTLSRVAQSCVQKGISLAVSNPCIELWFLLHWADVATYSAEQKEELSANKLVGNTRRRLEVELIQLAGQYKKRQLNAADYMPHIETAVGRARALDTAPNDRWPQTLGTRVYLLIESILAGSRH